MNRILTGEKLMGYSQAYRGLSELTVGEKEDRWFIHYGL